MKYLYGENFRKDLDEKGWAVIAAKKGKTIYVGAVNKEILSSGEDTLIDWFISGEAYKAMIKAEKADQAKKGGKTTLDRYGKEKMTEWGRKGGRPKKSS